VEADTLGQFVVVAPMAGRYRIRIEALGFETLLLGPIGIGLRSNEVLAELTPSPVPLDAVSAKADARTPKLAQVGFYDRMTRNVGHFLERSAIEKRGPRYTSDLLRGIAGVRVVMRGSSADVRLRSGGLTSFNARPGMQCLPPVFVDGILVSHGNQRPEERFDLNTLLPQDIEAVEIYAGPARVPPQFGGANAACGVILVWTR
jgi:outer membrane receptor for ferrienterochelin and colicin